MTFFSRVYWSSWNLIQMVFQCASILLLLMLLFTQNIVLSLKTFMLTLSFVSTGARFFTQLIKNIASFVMILEAMGVDTVFNLHNLLVWRNRLFNEFRLNLQRPARMDDNE